MNAERVRELFNYDPDTGLLTWRVKPNRRIEVGSVAGHKVPGRIRVNVDGIKQLVHRVIWLWVIGYLDPSLEVDHKDLNGWNNRWLNLRLATHSQNCQNMPKRSHSTQPYKGVWEKRGKWDAGITVNNEFHWLGSFNTPEDAYSAYVAASAIYHGEFGRTK